MNIAYQVKHITERRGASPEIRRIGRQLAVILCRASAISWFLLQSQRTNFSISCYTEYSFLFPGNPLWKRVFVFFCFLKVTMFNHILTITKQVCGAQDIALWSLYDQCMMSINIANLLIGSSGPEFHCGMNENTTHPCVINVSWKTKFCSSVIDFWGKFL